MTRRPNIEELQKVFVGRLLVPKLHGALQEAYDRALAGFDLTTRQTTILASCDIGESKTQADLVRIYSLEPSSINRLVDRLVKKGYLVRRRCKTDRRQVFLDITPEGKQHLWRAVPAAVEVAKVCWRGVTEQEKTALTSLVNKVVSNLETLGPSNHHKK